MSCFRLKSYSDPLPGTYVYECTVRGKYIKLGPFPIIEDGARALSNLRLKNGSPRSSLRECLEDFDHFQCTRLGNMGLYCVECDRNPSVVAMADTAPLIAPPCRGCGAPVSQ